jgi:hypothetical protein
MTRVAESCLEMLVCMVSMLSYYPITKSQISAKNARALSHGLLCSSQSFADLICASLSGWDSPFLSALLNDPADFLGFDQNPSPDPDWPDLPLANVGPDGPRRERQSFRCRLNRLQWLDHLLPHARLRCVACICA